MKKIIIIAIITLTCFKITLSQDTIFVDLHLKNLKKEKCQLKFKRHRSMRQSVAFTVKLNLSKADINDKYFFPISIPGTYEKRHYAIFNRNAKAIFNNNTINLKKTNDSFILPNKNISQIEYESIESKPPKGLFQPEDTYFSDSSILLNWNVLLGYFKNTNNTYKIRITKPKNLSAITSMPKTSINDTTDIFTANSYTELIHSPVMYSEPDTASFYSEDCLIKIACVPTLTNCNANIIKRQIKPLFNKILSESYYKPNKYTIIVMGDNSKLSYSMIALEHPTSTVLCIPQNFKDSTVVASIISHEFWHALYAPLNIESTTIKQLDYQKPICDEHLWFYEGCTEYLSQKKCVQAGIMDTSEFISEMYYNYNFSDKVNLAQISKHVYSHKGQKYYDNVYSKGAIIAFLLDLELLTKSNYQCSLSDLMYKMQKYQEQHGSFNSKELIPILSKLSGVDLSNFFKKYINSKQTINFKEEMQKVSYKHELQQKSDTVVYYYNVNSMSFSYQDNNKTICIIRNSDINKQLGMKKVNIYKVDGEEITNDSSSKLFRPKKESLELTIIDKGQEQTVKVTANKIKRKRTITRFKRLPNSTKLSTIYWQR